jgi:cell division protein FtsZ
MGDEIKVTVIAAGFERWDSSASGADYRSPSRGASSTRSTDSRSEGRSDASVRDIFADDDPLSGDDDFDVPSFMK